MLLTWQMMVEIPRLPLSYIKVFQNSCICLHKISERGQLFHLLSFRQAFLNFSAMVTPLPPKLVVL